MALPLYLYAMHVLGVEEVESKGSGERTRKGMEVILEESDGVV